MNDNNQRIEAEPPAVWPPVVSGEQSPEPHSTRRFLVPHCLVVFAAGTAVAVPLQEQNAEAPLWWLLLGCVLLWPPLAYVSARKSASPEAAQNRTLYGDALLAGVWMPVIGFSVVPSIALLLIPALHSLACGGGRLLGRTLPAQIASIIGVTFLLMHLERFQPGPASSLAVVLASLPLLLIYPLFLAAGSRRLVLKLEQRSRVLEHLSMTDPLSGLANRRYWEQALNLEFERSQRRNQPCSLVLLQIDRFRHFNQRYGHDVGDEAIVATADAISATLRAYDTAARYSGDEFGVLLPDTDSRQALSVISRLRTRLAQSPAVQDLPEPCTLSMGIRTLQPDAPDVPESPAIWLDQADRSLSQAGESARRAPEPSTASAP